jgi:CRP-like cAMP-binding protein
MRTLNHKKHQAPKNPNCTSEHSGASIGLIMDAMEFRAVEAGTVLCEEGEAANMLFVLVSGQCDVSIGGVRVSRVKPMNVFGESALFQNAGGQARRTATVTAGSPSAELLSLSKKAFDRLVASGTLSESCTLALAAHAVRRQQQDTLREKKRRKKEKKKKKERQKLRKRAQRRDHLKRARQRIRAHAAMSRDDSFVVQVESSSSGDGDGGGGSGGGGGGGGGGSSKSSSDSD